MDEGFVASWLHCRPVMGSRLLVKTGWGNFLSTQTLVSTSTHDQAYSSVPVTFLAWAEITAHFDVLMSTFVPWAVKCAVIYALLCTVMWLMFSHVFDSSDEISRESFQFLPANKTNGWWFWNTEVMQNSSKISSVTVAKPSGRAHK